jgi:hypothetical protein
MKLVQTTIIAGLSFFLSTGISFAADMDDLDLTIRIIETDDVKEMHNELHLPDAASDIAREHAANEESRGLTQANAVRESENEHEAEHENEVRDEHEADRDERIEDRSDANEVRDEAYKDEHHRAE